MTRSCATSVGVNPRWDFDPVIEWIGSGVTWHQPIPLLGWGGRYRADPTFYGYWSKGRPAFLISLTQMLAGTPLDACLTIGSFPPLDEAGWKARFEPYFYPGLW